MKENRGGRRRRGREIVPVAACALGLELLLSVPAQAASPQFAYSEEKWASLKDNTLEFEEIADLIHEYNSTVKKNALEYKDYKGKDSDEIAQTYYDTADEIYASIEYPDSDASNYGSLLASAQSSELSADQMMEKGDENVADADVKLWGYTKTEKTLVQTAQNQMISYWNAVISLESKRNAVEKAQTSMETAQKKLAAGTGTQTDVLTAQESLYNAQAAVTTAESTIAATKESLCLSLGWSYGSEVEIKALPEPAESYSSTVNLEEDIAKAVENNYDLMILNREVKNARVGTVQREYELSLESSKEAVKSSVQSAYQSLLLAETQYTQAQKSYELEERSMQSAERKKAAGTISSNAYQTQQYAYADARVEKETAAVALLKAQLAYQWAVNGLAASA
ncbi:MAG: TolC family protein [Clostridium sp.]|nr:TolC family protein [Clostridium sp.]